jgi:hypothetical protein
MENELAAFHEEMFSYQWIHVGLTQYTHDGLKLCFSTMQDRFGTYDRFCNNCTHFVIRACEEVLYMENKEVSPMLLMKFKYTIDFFLTTFFNHQEELMSLIFRCLIGPGEFQLVCITDLAWLNLLGRLGQQGALLSKKSGNNFHG